MDVQDLLKLQNWIDFEVARVLPSFEALGAVLNQNSRQAAKKPVQEPLEDLLTILSSSETKMLSIQQLRVLDQNLVGQLFGLRGVKWVESLIRTQTFDPATAATEMQNAIEKLKKLREGFNQFLESAIQIGIERAYPKKIPESFEIAVMFQEGASIQSVPDLKRFSAEWDQIIAGITGAVGERPEDVRVTGVSNGSILIYLSATAAATGLLAIIAKHASQIVSCGLNVAMQLQDLRKKKLHNAVIEKELRNIEKNARENAASAALIEIEKMLGEGALEPEVSVKLENSIKKLLDFREKGGDLDFSTPEGVVLDNEEFDNESAQLFNSAVDLVETAQKAKQAIQLLEADNNADITAEKE